MDEMVVADKLGWLFIKVGGVAGSRENFKN